MPNFKQIHHWFTSELKFKNSADMLRCKAQLEKAISGDSYLITVEPAETGVHFSGCFDFIAFNASFNTILTGYDLKENYKIKCIFQDADGYFGGWVEEYNRKGDLVQAVSLSEIFDGEITPHA